MSKIAVGTRVQDNGGDREWGTVSAVNEYGKIRVNWDSGFIGEMWWDPTDWLFDQPNDPRQPAGPVRTETVTKRRIVPGVYGRLRVAKSSLTDEICVTIEAAPKTYPHSPTPLTQRHGTRRTRYGRVPTGRGAP